MEALKELEQILKLAEKYAEKHHIIFCDYHRRMVVMAMSETIKLCSQRVLEPMREAINHDMDIYGNQVPNGKG